MNNDSQLRITLPKCVAISQKLRITFHFLNPAQCVCVCARTYMYVIWCMFELALKASNKNFAHLVIN